MRETIEQKRKRLAEEERRRRQQNTPTDTTIIDPLNPIFSDPEPAGTYQPFSDPVPSYDPPSSSWGGFSGGDSGNAGATDSFGGGDCGGSD